MLSNNICILLLSWSLSVLCSMGIRWLFLCCFLEFIQPVKERPRTDCAVARRMVTRALGLQGRGRVQRYWREVKTPQANTGEQNNTSDEWCFIRKDCGVCWGVVGNSLAMVVCVDSVTMFRHTPITLLPHCPHRRGVLCLLTLIRGSFWKHFYTLKHCKKIPHLNRDLLSPIFISKM